MAAEVPAFCGVAGTAEPRVPAGEWGLLKLRCLPAGSPVEGIHPVELRHLGVPAARFIRVTPGDEAGRIVRARRVAAGAATGRGAQSMRGGGRFGRRDVFGSGAAACAGDAADACWVGTRSSLDGRDVNVLEVLAGGLLERARRPAPAARRD